MPLPARLQEMAVGRPLAVLAVLGCAVACLRVVSQAQADVTDSDLAALNTRTVALGALGGEKIGDVPLEIYVARVLAGEGEPNAPEATQQALAVAIRTYAVFNTGPHTHEGFDLCDSTHCPVPLYAHAN